MEPTGLIPEDVLTRTDLRAALKEHDFAAAFALIKKYSGLSQNRIAAACQLSPGKVSTIISGAHQITSYEVLCRISDGLRIPGHLLGLAARPWETVPEQPTQEPAPAGPRDSALDVPWQPNVTVGLAADLTRSDLMMDRRTAAQALTAAAATGAALLDSLEAWLQPPGCQTDRRCPGRLGQRDIAQLEHTAQAFRRWDHQYGGGLQRKAVLGQLNEIAAALDEHQAPAIEKRLYRVMAQLAGTAATMAWDCGLQRRSQDYYRLAPRASHAGGDTLFGANVLAGMARQMLEYGDRPQDALELVRLAQHGARGEAGHRVQAMLYTREARVMAAMGRTAAFRRATEQAREELGASEPGEGPYWIAYFDDAELAGVTGGRLLDLARQDPRRHAEEASVEIGQALARRGVEASRSHALDRIGLAECHFLMGDTATAVQYAHDAVDAVEHTQSGRVRERLAELYRYTVGQSASRAVRETRDRMRDLLAG